jgi:hypothetical protein
MAGMWVERWWLVTPTLSDHLTLGVAELSIAAALLAVFILAAGRFNQWMGPVMTCEEPES